VIAVTSADGSVTHQAYRGWQTLTLDATGHQTLTEQDELGRTVAVTECQGNYTQPAWTAAGAVMRYEHNAIGELTGVLDALGNVTRIRYDAQGRKVALADPSMGTWHYHYDPKGNLIRQIDARGQGLAFTHDALGRVTVKSDVGMWQLENGSWAPVAASLMTRTLASYVYGTSGWGVGQRVAMTDDSGTTLWAYDARGRVISVRRGC